MDHLKPLGVRRTKIGADGKQVAFLVSPTALLTFAVVSVVMLGAAAYYSLALDAQIRDLHMANGWEESDNIDEETRLAHHFFHSAEILVNIVQSEQQTVEDGVIVSQVVLRELGNLKTSVDDATDLEQILALVEQFDRTVTKVVGAYADSNTQLAARAKLLSKSLATVLSAKGEGGVVDQIDDMPEWKEISTWNQISRAFAFVTDVAAVEVPQDVQETLMEELDVLDAGVFPTGAYERPTDVREEMQQLLTDPSVHGVRPNVIYAADTPEQVREIIREVLQVVLVKEHIDVLEELQTEWMVDGAADDAILQRLEKLEADGIIPLFWIAGPDIVGVRPRKFLWWLRPSPFDVMLASTKHGGGGDGTEQRKAAERRAAVAKAVAREEEKESQGS